MRRLIYGFGVSLDGYVNDRAGNIDWTDPDDELHQYHNDRYRGIEVSLHGRRLYELMADYWPHLPDTAPPIEREFARLWTEVHWNSTMRERLNLRLAETRHFDSVIMLRYVTD